MLLESLTLGRRQVVVQIVGVVNIDAIEHIHLTPVQIRAQVHLVGSHTDVRLNVDIALRTCKETQLQTEMSFERRTAKVFRHILADNGSLFIVTSLFQCCNVSQLCLLPHHVLVAETTVLCTNTENGRHLHQTRGFVAGEVRREVEQMLQTHTIIGKSAVLSLLIAPCAMEQDTR